MPPVIRQRLLSESVLYGTQKVLHSMPVEYSQELETAVRAGVLYAVMHYAKGLETRERQLDPIGYAKKGRA